MAPTLEVGLQASRAILAHGGGAPEALTITVPLLVVVGFVVAELRVRRRDRAANSTNDSTNDSDSDSADAAGQPPEDR